MVKTFSKTLILLVMFFFITVSTSWALYIADITYDYTDNGGGNYTFDFTVYNNSTDPDNGGLDFFLMEFDADLTISNYSNVSWTSDNSWYSEASNYDPSFGSTPAAVLADDSVDFGSGGGGIAQTDSLGGFTVNFDYAGSLLPTEQLFSWYVAFGSYYDAVDDIVVVDGEDFGTTRYVPDNNNPVPEPATMLLFGLGLLGLAGVSRKK